MAISERYPGVYAAMATPIGRDGAVDRAGIARVVDYLFDSGVTGLSILGSTGEGPALTIAQRQRALDATLEASAGRGAVFTGAASSVVSEVIDSLKTVAGTGARGALVPPPYYYRLDDTSLTGFFERIAEASPVPIILYNIPVMTKLQLPPPVVARLSEHPNIMGLKDSGGDFGYFATLARLVGGNEGFTLYTGSDELLAPALFVGGHGLIGGAVNIVPDVLSQIYRAYHEGGFERAVALARQVARANAAVRVGTFPAGIKGQYALKGLCERYTAAPVLPLTDAEMERLRQQLTEAGVLQGLAVTGD
ncbi:MAG: 4-hydroxy-tetrahydrodipicolinate synthase [uncultured Thermomicrobiales bacterium]|uniref:4-hydroxy-tetrahydrodipicolinate synthase n=1 Tax=uncultured Thermomicrobiales bacterium TaxID=1645740 RepID=A0A6J4VZH8_9BACT|nr:MAG: 4-hydroxy-tetrahydrodipicolinate synthase [uncultured Thermomicrobiales bacterium]